jgi:putative transposase
MKARRHTPEQVVRKLREADRLLAEGRAIGEVCRHLEVCEATYHRWQRQFGEMKADDVKRLKGAGAREPALEGHRGRSGAGEPGASGGGEGKLVSPARRRQAVAMVRDRLGLSERRAWRCVAQQRSTQRREPTVACDDQALRAALCQVAGDRPRWGYRRAHHELCQRGWSVNRKRIQRLWREEGLRVAQRARKRRRAAGQPDRSQLRASGPDEVWPWTSRPT